MKHINAEYAVNEATGQLYRIQKNGGYLFCGALNGRTAKKAIADIEATEYEAELNDFAQNMSVY